jgi:hypothetical protein
MLTLNVVYLDSDESVRTRNLMQSQPSLAFPLMSAASDCLTFVDGVNPEIPAQQKTMDPSPRLPAFAALTHGSSPDNRQRPQR